MWNVLFIPDPVLKIIPNGIYSIIVNIVSVTKSWIVTNAEFRLKKNIFKRKSFTNFVIYLFLERMEKRDIWLVFSLKEQDLELNVFFLGLITGTLNVSYEVITTFFVCTVSNLLSKTVLLLLL